MNNKKSNKINPMPNKAALKTILLVSLAFTTASLGSCIGKSDNKGTEQQVVSVEQAYNESNASGTIDKPAATSKTINQIFGTNKDSFIRVEIPTEGSKTLTNNIMEWINESLGGTYTGSLDDTDNMIDHYKSLFLESMEEADELSEMTGSYVTIDIHKVYEDELVVTYMCHSESFYSGAAHGAHKRQGQTFRKSDGKTFTCEYIDFQQLRNNIKDGLKIYLNAENDEELFDRLFNIDNVDEIPVPESNPWIGKKGVTFIYQSYEIASYSDGTPTVTISKEKIKKVLNATGKTFLK